VRMNGRRKQTQRCSKLEATNYSNASLGNLTYTWDVNKNKKSESIGGVMSGYGFTNAGTTYDDEDRLTGYQRTNGALNQSWNLTSVGDWNSVTTNGTAQSRTHGPTHELLTAGGQTVNTDVKGNITLLPSALSSLASTALGMSWDFDNKLKSVDVGNNSSTDVEYKYDALGRRVARVGSSGSFVYVQSDQQTIADYGVGDAPSSPLYRYVYASYIDEPVVRKGAGTGGTIHYYHRNQQYSVTAVTTSAGAIAERYAYSAYGEPTICDASGSVIASSAINNRYSYTGREWDATVGLYHFRARWMSPKTGRFLGRDPIGYEGSPFDLYEYCDSSVLIYTDPTGEDRYQIGGKHPGDHSIICVDLYHEWTYVGGPGGPTGFQYCCELGQAEEGSGGSPCLTAPYGSLCNSISMGAAFVGLWAHPAEIQCSIRKLTESEKKNASVVANHGGPFDDERIRKKLEKLNGKPKYWNGVFSNCHDFAGSHLYP